MAARPPLRPAGPPPARPPVRAPPARPPIITQPAPRAAPAPPPWSAFPPEEAPGFHVSGTEVAHLAVTMVVLSLVFAFGLTRDAAFELRAPTQFELDKALDAVPLAGAVALLGVLLHELMHKLVAQRLALWAEFRASVGGLLAALVLVFSTGVIFAAPGAVVIVGNATKRDGGLISVAGPLTNLALAFAFLPMGSNQNPFEVGQVGNFFQLAVMMNLMLGGFNLLPIPPLDGIKIARWSMPVYLAMVGLCGLLILLLFGAIPL